MKKQTKYILIIFIFSVIIILIDLPNGYIKGHDTDFHMPAITAMVEQLSWDNLTVQEPLKYIGNDLGYGTRFFYPPLPHLTATYITKILTIFNVNNVSVGMRITQWLAILASGITFYFLVDKILNNRNLTRYSNKGKQSDLPATLCSNNKKIAALLSLFYMSAPYHLGQIFIRDSFSEMLIPIAIPLIILGLLYLIEKKYKLFFYCFVTGYVIAIYSHLAMTVYFTLMILVTFFIIYFKEIFTKKNILYLVSASALILLLTAAFWMPMLEIKIKGSYGVFMPYYIAAKGDLRNSTISIFELFAFNREIDFHFIRYNLQLFVTIMFSVSVFFFIKKKMWKEKIWVFFLAFTILSAIMITSLFPWYYTPDILQALQFPWRIALYITFGAIPFVGICLTQIENKKYFNIVCGVLLVLTLVGTYINIDHLEEEQIDLNNLNNYKCMGNQVEYLPEKAINNREYFDNRTKDIIIREGNGEITKILDDVPDLIFEVNTNEEITIELPRIYYMGYELKINENKIELTESENGFLQAVVNESGTYKLTYEKTAVMKIANILSLATAFVLLILIMMNKKFNWWNAN